MLLNVAIEETLRAANLHAMKQLPKSSRCFEAGEKPGGETGDRRIGVVWHTQGAGKSLSMAFYAGRISCILLMETRELCLPTVTTLTISCSVPLTVRLSPGCTGPAFPRPRKQPLKLFYAHAVAVGNCFPQQHSQHGPDNYPAIFFKSTATHNPQRQ